MATIKLKNSGTAGAVPTAGQLTTGEVAVNSADGAIFLKDTTGAVVQVARKLATSGVTITGTDQTLPVHSAGVAAAIAAQAPSVIAAWLASLPTDPTGLPSGSIFRNGELFGIVP